MLRSGVAVCSVFAILVAGFTSPRSGYGSWIRWGAFVNSHPLEKHCSYATHWALFSKRVTFLSAVLIILLSVFASIFSTPGVGAAIFQSRNLRGVRQKPVISPEKTGVSGIPEKNIGCPTKFVTAIASDGHGGVWVSGEGFGIYHGIVRDAIGAKARARAKKAGALPRFHWHHFDVANSPGLASNFITALCVDGQGRLWAGTNRHGVCVFNGKKWAHYNIINGPLGSHIYATAYNRIANQVWIATENGISIYQCSENLPSHNSRLPSSPPR